MDIKYICTKEDFKKYTYNDVTEFDTYRFFDKMKEFCKCFNCEISRDEWFDENYEPNWKDFVILIDNKIVSRAAVWMRYENKWEVSAVLTLPEFRRKGYSIQLVSCCTDYILSREKIATCTTGSNNVPMKCLAEKIGYKKI